ncbi:nucleoside triphosphate pyrophosphohydrolase [Christensenellaceae bacterium OttesenSCG-928-K19]|nr:nucleoside triphosphate pyrophosphohydrolase [Christensenellaceae bacterium OttesenSCG-928-K19]
MIKIKVMELPVSFDLFTFREAKALEECGMVVLQSAQGSVAEGIRGVAREVQTLDGLFETAQDFDALYEEGAKRIMEAAQEQEVVFCTIGDVLSNGFVDALRERRAKLELVHGADSVAGALLLAAQKLGGINGYAVVDARELEEAYLDTSKVLVVRGIDDSYTAADAKLALLCWYAPQVQGVLVRGERAEEMEITRLDRIESFGEGAVYVLPGLNLAQKEIYSFYDLVDVLKILRGKNGCPWDREQTHKTLRQYLLEESYEVMDAIDAEDMDALYDELGDVLLQVVFHAEIARQCGEFTHIDVTTSECAKMISRHTHIFGDAKADTADEVVTNWEAIKRKEKGNETYTSVLRDVPRTMGAMMRAYKIQKKAGNVGFDWDDAQGALAKVKEETAELAAEIARGDADAVEAEAGDLLFAVVNVLRKCGVNPEVALTRTCEKFIRRFEYIEKHAEIDLKELSLTQMDTLWEQAKMK